MPPTSSAARNLVCFSPIDWDEVWEGPQEIMSRFAATGWNVLFVENVAGRVPRFSLHDAARSLTRIKKLLFEPPLRVATPQNLTVHTPENLPPYGWLRGMNHRLLLRGLRARLRELGWNHPVVWTYVPSALVREVAQALDPQLMVYCCIHDYAAISKQHAYLAEEEKQMVRTADLVFVLSRQLLEERRKINPAARLLPQGANLGHYLADTANCCPPELVSLKPPVIGYIGTIHEWVDHDLLLFVARQRPDWNFVFIGPEKVNLQRLRELPNVTFLGARAHDQLPAYVQRFDAGIIPYVTHGFARTIRPNKVLEYLVMGKPVVTTDLPELREFASSILMADSPQQFVDAIDLALKTDSPQKRCARRTLAEARSMNRKFGELSATLLSRMEAEPERVLSTAR